MQRQKEEKKKKRKKKKRIIIPLSRKFEVFTKIPEELEDF